MQIFRCTCNGQPQIFFESTQCVACRRPIGFSDELQRVVPLNVQNNGTYTLDTSATAEHYRLCTNNSQHGVCNGLTKFNSNQNFCQSCRYNQVIPNLKIDAHLSLWRNLENAKRRTLYTLNRLGLNPLSRAEDNERGLSFHFLTDKSAHDNFQSHLPGMSPVFTGHDDGEITINLAEADDVARHKAKQNLDEKYRTLLGHFRHEIGHFYWDVLIDGDNTRQQGFRQLFGDERVDYQAAMDAHYKNGPSQNWQNNFISHYASMHPWEDWAETWAHYLHILETLDTAQSHGLINSDQPQQDSPIYQTDINVLLDIWVSFSVKLNALNRSMGLPDAYPFVLNNDVYQKLSFIDGIVR